MPTYQYACKACDERLEAVQSFSDAPLTECPACGGALRKVFSAVGVVFKGSGFYKTDSRDGGGAKAGSGAEAKTEGAKSDGAQADSGKSDSGKSDSAGKPSGSTASTSAGSASSTPKTPAPASKSA